MHTTLMEKKLAVIFEGNINNRLGVFNAVVNRVKHLREIADYHIDVFMIQVYDGRIMAKLRHANPPANRPTTIVADGVTINIRWFKRSFCDALGHRLFHKQPARFLHFLRIDLVRELQSYDAISAHDRIAGNVAAACHKAYGVPFFITWHGTSIHTEPTQDVMLKAITAQLLESATCNFFVSRELARLARNITSKPFKQEILLNGASAQFHRLPQQRRDALRQQFCVPTDSKVVAFVGRFEAVKSPNLLPEIFALIKRQYAHHITFWAIGDGDMLPQTKAGMAQAGVDCNFWGLQIPDKMPEFMNCIDVLILPSRLEGLPLVAIEALSCGANVVATDVGGTAKAIGADNVFTLDASFSANAAHRAAEMLSSHIDQQLPPDVSWTATAQKENAIYKRWLNAN